MANEEELLVLNQRPRDMDKCLAVVKVLQSYTVKRLIQGYKDKSETPPKVLTAGFKPDKFLVNSLDSHVSKTGILPSRSTFQLSQPS